MKLVARDFAKLRWHLGLAAVALVVSALLVLWGLRHERDSLQKNLAATQALQQIETRLKQVREEEQEIRQKSALFLQLQQAGVLGDERRLDWTELLAETQRQLRLPAMDFEFSPQAALEGSTASGYSFSKSSMKLRLGLLHEDDLLRFLDAVESRASALIVPQSCTLTRNTTPVSGRDGLPANLAAECELDWITARPVEKAKP